jgi:hypothetical protein
VAVRLVDDDQHLEAARRRILAVIGVEHAPEYVVIRECRQDDCQGRLPAVAEHSAIHGTNGGP